MIGQTISQDNQFVTLSEAKGLNPSPMRFFTSFSMTKGAK